jgi:hypothetical protein
LNLDTLNSAADIPVLSYLLWAGAVVALVAAVFLMVWDAAANFVLAIVFWAVTCGLGMTGIFMAIDASTQVRDASFHSELDKIYSLRTDATLTEIGSAAKQSKTVLLKSGNDIFEARPHVDGSTLIFIRASDGKVVEPIAS